MSTGVHHVRQVKWEKLVPALIAVVGVISYLNTFSNPFVFDDQVVILSNPKVRDWWPPWENCLGLTRSVADLSFALNYAVGGWNVADYHAANLLIHIAAGLLLFGIVKRSLRLPGLSDQYGNASVPLALAAAVLWVAHPLQTESVTYLCQRIESLMGMFYLLALYSVIRADGSPRPKAWATVAIVACALGMATKEIMATAPVTIFLYDWIFLSRGLRQAWKRHGALHLGLVSTWLLLAAPIAASSQKIKATFAAGAELSPFSYALAQCGAILQYLRLSLFPHPLCLDYGPWTARPWSEMAPAIAVVVTLVAVTLWALRRHPELGFCGVWFFAILAPTSSVIPLPDVMFEHRIYLPLAAICVLAVIAVHRLFRAVSARFSKDTLLARLLPALLFAIVAATCVALTWRRNRDYASEEAIWRDVVAKRPDNARAGISLCGTLMEQGRFREAEQCARAALARIESSTKMTRDQVPEDLNPDARHDFRWLATVYARLENNLGLAIFHQGRNEEAIEHYRNATSAWPKYVPPRNNLALAYLLQGRTNEAVEIWTQVLRDAPDNETAHGMMASVAEDGGRFKEAIDHYSTALAANPGSAFLRGRLAWMLATHWDSALRNGAQALELAEALARSTAHQGVRVLDILAAACAEAGQFPEAVRWAEKALTLAREPAEARRGPGVKPPGGGEAALLPETGSSGKSEKDRARYLEQLEQRLLLYRSGKPYHEAPPAERKE